MSKEIKEERLDPEVFKTAVTSFYEDEEAKVNRCSCGYIFNNDTEYRFCPFCGASKEEAD